MNLDNLPPPYVLNLPKSKKRLQLMTRHLVNVHDLKFYLYPATLGKDVDVLAIKDLGYLPPRYVRPTSSIGLGMLGCMESHRRMWEDIKDKHTGPVLVLEDDARLVPGFLDKLKVILSSVPDDGWDYINLCALRCEGLTKDKGTISGLKDNADWTLKKAMPVNNRLLRFKRRVPNAWTSTYLVHAESIPKLLAAWKDESSKGRFYEIRRRLYHLDWLWSFMAHVPEYKIDFYSLRKRAIAYREESTSDLRNANK